MSSIFVQFITTLFRAGAMHVNTSSVFLLVIFFGGTVGAVVTTLTSQQEGLGFDSQVGQDFSEWSLHVLSVLGWVSLGTQTCQAPPGGGS